VEQKPVTNAKPAGRLWLWYFPSRVYN